MNIDPRQLLQLAEIVDSKSFASAAERLHTSQPALSRTIKSLELRLGATLFDRRNKPASPTELALSLAELGRSVRAASERASVVGERFLSGEQGTLRVGVSPFFQGFRFNRATAQFAQAHPGVRLIVRPDFISSLRSKLLEGLLDIAISPIELIDDGSPLAMDRLTSFRHVLLCRRNHPLGKIPAVTVTHLEDATWICHVRESALYSNALMILRKFGLDRIDVALESASIETTLSVLQESDCLTILPDYTVMELVEKKRIQILDPDIDHLETSLGVVSCRDNVLSATAQNFARLLQREYAGSD